MTAPVDSRRRRHRPLRPAVGVAVALVLLAGCTDDGGDEPPPADPPPAEESAGPPAGRDVAVVLPAATAVEPAVLDGLETRLDALAADLPEQVGQLRVHRPDGPPFVADLLELAAARQAQLACVLGPGTTTLADTVARRHGATTVCSLPAEPPPADVEPARSALRVEAPVFELGVLVGTAARVEALARAPEPAPPPEAEDADGSGDTDGSGDADDEPADPADGDEAVEEPEPPPPPVVGLVLGGDALDADAFRAGLLEGLGGIEAIEVAASDAEPVDALAAVLAAGAEVVVFDGALGAAAALATAPPSVAVLVPVDLAPQGDAAEEGPSLLLAYRLRWELLVADVVQQVVSGDPVGPSTTGTAELLDLRPGPTAAGLEAALQQVLEELLAGEGTGPATAPQTGESRDADT
jgi:hypothetical protein